MYNLTLNNEREMCQLTRKMREFVVVKFAFRNEFHGIVYIENAFQENYDFNL